MEFLSAMFKGIGDTFTAGASVNLGQMNERNVKRQALLAENTLRTDSELAQYDLLRSMEAERTKKIALIIFALIALFFLILYFKAR